MSLAVRAYTAESTDIKAIRFITSCLVPPPKKAVLAHLGIPLNPGEEPEKPPPEIVRRAEADVSPIRYTMILRSYFGIPCSLWLVLRCYQRVSSESCTLVISP